MQAARRRSDRAEPGRCRLRALPPGLRRVRGGPGQGAVIFSGCSLPEATFEGCDLSGAAFDDCNLRATTFGSGTYKATDLRGNDLSGLSGAVNLRKVVIDRHQLTDLAAAWAEDLGIAFGDER
ncbi:pentapeptide repeat-containing protein [Catenulispora yoronensis]